MAFSLSSNCVMISQSSARLSTRFQPALTWNPISSRLALLKRKTDESSFWAISNKTPQYSSRDTRKSFVVCDSTEPASVPPSTPGKSVLRWIIGGLLSFKNNFENGIQVVENVVEVVQKVAVNIQNMAQGFAGGLPQGKLHELVEKVEHVAEHAAQAAGCLDNVIDKIQGDEDNKVDESAIKDAKKTSPEAGAVKVLKEN